MKHLVFCLICLLWMCTFAEKEVGGVITRDTRWNAADGPFRITADLLVSRNVRLTITAGTRIVVGGYPGSDTAVEQYDDIDRRTVAVKINGALISVGKSDKRIVFSSDSTVSTQPAWYGIVFDHADALSTEIANTDITGAYCGLTCKQSAPAITKCIIEYNHIGILVDDLSAAHIYNCIIAYNYTTGIRITNANPEIMNCIIAFNRNNGIWCDGHSKVVVSYNCVAGNSDGDLLSCDPEIGLPVRKNGHGDSVDTYKNIFTDPVFSGSVAETTATEQDTAVPTPVDKIRNIAIAKILHGDQKKSSPSSDQEGRYRLSRYSPCIDAGNPGGSFKDRDGSRNDMGIWGGPEYIKTK